MGGAGPKIAKYTIDRWDGRKTKNAFLMMLELATFGTAIYGNT